MIRNVKELYEKYERYLSPVAFLLGFTWDSLTLSRVDLWLDNLIILVYLTIVSISITVRNVYDAARFRGRIADTIAGLIPFLMQFALGGLFSAFFIFYARSASFTASWLFLFFLAALLIGNELFRERYLRLPFQMSVFFIALFAYSVFALPVLIGKLGAGVFLLSGLVSLLLIWLLIRGLSYLIPQRIEESKRALIRSIGSIYIIFNILYFTNIIPPIPLSLKEHAIYHSVERTQAGTYLVQFEPAPWYHPFREVNPVFHRAGNEPVYSFSAVFAPTNIDTNIFHRWSRFDKEKDEWVQEGRFGFPIFGGREGGYRGFTIKYNPKPGKWRVDVITERGQVLGRTSFRIVDTSTPPELETAVR